MTMRERSRFFSRKAWISRPKKKKKSKALGIRKKEVNEVCIGPYLSLKSQLVSLIYSEL